MPRPIALTVSLSSLRHNLDVVIRGLEHGPAAGKIARPKVWAVIKANAYGHGIDNAIQALNKADGLAMLDFDEAVRARQAGWTGPILMLEGFFDVSDIAVLDAYRLTPVLHCDDQFQMLEHADLTQPIDAFIKLNTGMNRLGFMPCEFARAWTRALALHDARILATVGKMTHFSRADDDLTVTQAQQRLFFDTTRGMQGPVSLCNSAATLTASVWSCADPAYEQWVRPGICLYGGSPFEDRSATSLELRPAQTLQATLLAVRDLPAGASIGYGHEYTSTEPIRMGVVSCGYADGYPRLAGTGTPVTVDGVSTRILGRVSMDMLVVDVTAVPHAAPGSTVILWGEGGPPIDDVARCANTTGYELMCAVAPRVPRRVV